MRQVPHINELYTKYNNKGLHIIGLYAQAQPMADVRKVLADKKIEFPQALAWIDEQGAWPVAVLPKVWIIGVDGKVKFAGEGEGYDKILEEELAKVKHPGLGNLKVPAELEDAAKAYAASDYTKAHTLAEAAAAKEGASDEILEAASALKDKVSERLKALTNKAEVAEVENDWPLCVATWEAIVKRFASYEDAADAKEKLAALKADKKVLIELEAAIAIRVIDRELNTKHAALDEWIKRYKEFDAKYKETSWHERAASAIERMEEEWKATEEAKKKEGK